MSRDRTEASSNGRTADFGSAYEGSNPSASTKPQGVRSANQRAEVKPLPMPERVILVALGPVQRALVDGVGAAVTAAYGAPVAVGAGQQRPSFAFNKDRNQYHSAAVLRRLAQVRGDRSDVPVLGVTDVDLFVPDAPFVFGEADRDARAALVSLARLSTAPDGQPADPERLRRRVSVEAVHEVGHLLGLSHCQDVHCAMFLSHKASDSDRKGPGLCASCRNALGLT